MPTTDTKFIGCAFCDFFLEVPYPRAHAYVCVTGVIGKRRKSRTTCLMRVYP
jgi:hypothetical protein